MQTTWLPMKGDALCKRKSNPHRFAPLRSYLRPSPQCRRWRWLRPRGRIHPPTRASVVSRSPLPGYGNFTFESGRDSSTQSGLAHADETAQVSASTICPDRSPPGRRRRVVGPPAGAARHQAESASCPGRWTRRPETGIPSGASAAQHPAPPTTQGFVTVSQRSGQESGWPHSACQAPLPHPIPVTRSSPRWMTSGCNSP